MDSSVSQILILLVLLLLSGIFSSAETALTTYNKISICETLESTVKNHSFLKILIKFLCYALLYRISLNFARVR